MTSFIAIAQGFKVATGLAQVAFAIWIMIRRPVTRVNTAFAVSFGANGTAFAIWNVTRPGLRTPHSLALEGRGVFDWIATLAMLLFALFFLRMVQHSRARLLILPVSITLAMLASDILKARAYRLDLLAFGGIAIYLTTAFALSLLALIFATESSIQVRNRCALFCAALAINYADHIGASIVRPSWGSVATPTIQVGGMRWDAPADAAVEIGATLIILTLWLWNSRTSERGSSRMALPVVLTMVASFLAGVLVRTAVGSYRAVQESGFFGLGLIAATALLIYGMLARGLFSPLDERDSHAASAGGN
jgi:hypothetical protein